MGRHWNGDRRGYLGGRLLINVSNTLLINHIATSHNSSAKSPCFIIKLSFIDLFLNFLRMVIVIHTAILDAPFISSVTHRSYDEMEVPCA